MLSPPAKQQWEALATAAVGANLRAVSGAESWSPRGVQTLESRPVASTGVQISVH